MPTVTTDRIEGRRIVAYLGIVRGDAIVAAKMFRDFFASIRDVVGTDLDYETAGVSMLMVGANSTAVRLA